jgi:hypothetical protein
MGRDTLATTDLGVLLDTLTATMDGRRLLATAK